MANSHIHWRNTARPARFFAMDARACLVVLLFLIYARVWTLVLMIAVLTLCVILERFGMTFPVALRRMRSFFVGPYRRALVKASRRRFIDRGGY